MPTMTPTVPTVQSLYAGRAMFSIINPDGERYTFRIPYKEADAKYKYPSWFVRCQHGNNPWSYLGKLSPPNDAKRDLWSTSKSPVGTPEWQLAAKIFKFALAIIEGRRSLPSGYVLTHCGKCAVCGKRLKTEASIAAGIGPTCLAKAAERFG
jgi:hypothetical protein